MMAVRPQGYIRSNISCRYLICSQGSLYETFPTIVNPIIVCRLYIGGYREININYFPLIIARISLKENLGVCKHVFHTFRIKSVFTFNINIWNKYKNQLIISILCSLLHYYLELYYFVISLVRRVLHQLITQYVIKSIMILLYEKFTQSLIKCARIVFSISRTR